jgi:hypothetical protein
MILTIKENLDFDQLIWEFGMVKTQLGFMLLRFKRKKQKTNTSHKMTIPKAFLDHKKRHYLGWC